MNSIPFSGPSEVQQEKCLLIFVLSEYAGRISESYIILDELSKQGVEHICMCRIRCLQHPQLVIEYSATYIKIRHILPPYDNLLLLFVLNKLQNIEIR